MAGGSRGFGLRWESKQTVALVFFLSETFWQLKWPVFIKKIKKYRGSFWFSQRKADFAAKGRFRNKRPFSQPISQLRNGGNCAAKWHSCAKVWFHSYENFRREGPEVAKWFRSKVAISQRLLLGCEISQTPDFSLFYTISCSKWLSFNFFAIPSTWDHSKRLSYI